MDSLPVKASLFGAARSFSPQKDDHKAVEVLFNNESKVIDLTLFEYRQESSIPLNLQFQYVPLQPFAPIHKVAVGRTTHIKDFYWHLWFGDDEKLPEINVRNTFTGPEVEISVKDVETFCAIVENQQEAFKTVRTANVKAPMDFAIITGWQAIVKSIFPVSIDGDFLKLVHLTNGFKVVPGVKTLQAGIVCKAEAKVTAVINSDAGEGVGYVICEDKRVM